MSPATRPSGGRPLGELLRELASETGTLVRQEMRLAKTEMEEKATTAARHGAVVGAGSALLHVGVAAVTAAVIAGLATMMALWLAALVVAVVLLGIGFALVRTGLSGIRRIDPTPDATMKTLKEDKLWVKRELSR